MEYTNHINSMLIEGMVSTSPSEVIGMPADFRAAGFRLTSNYRRYDENDQIETASFDIDVMSYGDLADKVLATLKEGYIVRVIGRIFPVMHEDVDGHQSQTFIVKAQHMEFNRKVAGKIEEHAYDAEGKDGAR